MFLNPRLNSQPTLDQKQRQHESGNEPVNPSEPLKPPSSIPNQDSNASENIRRVREKMRKMREEDPLKKHEQEAEERAKNRREQQGE